MRKLSLDLEKKRKKLLKELEQFNHRTLKSSKGVEPESKDIITIKEAYEGETILGIWLITCPSLRHSLGNWTDFYFLSTVKRKRRLKVGYEAGLIFPYKFYVLKTKSYHYCSCSAYGVSKIGELIWRPSEYRKETGVFLPHYIDSSANY